MLTATAHPAPSAPDIDHVPGPSVDHRPAPGHAPAHSADHSPGAAPSHASDRTQAAAPTRAFVRWVPEPTTATVPLVRSRVHTLLAGWRIAADVADTLLLAVSELVGNVVRHAAAATGRMRVAVSRGEGWLCLRVTDGAADLPRVPERAAEVDADAEGGRGLLLIQLMAAEAGGELAVLIHESGKCVRVRLPLP
ncbi:ATP-binding protein [Streptomyces sp. NBC_00572]|uniref:ATP-binding protein n=1 Tax=Streptomyces sp. NBC_00572 TaxID=2903664 RepID=UPI0022538E48|nr:ATP-binding protein [Streptomyces sp. NBC_00572]MCX4985768.1 ATP-binding protein [Streptomyces sp. NBC_00572]